MGTYLSTPVTEKCQESGESLECPVVPVSWGVVDMQGWRKSMEDAHVAQTDITVPPHHLKSQQLQPSQQQSSDGGGEEESKTAAVAASADSPMADAKVFGVFDGHGGPEVARFCQLYLVSVLTQQSAWKEESSNSTSDMNPALRGVGEALVTTFHALDRMIDDPSRRDEIVRLRTLKPSVAERREATNIPPVAPVDSNVAPPDSGGLPSLVTSNSIEEDSPAENPTAMAESKGDAPDGESSSNEMTDAKPPQQETAESSASVANVSEPDTIAEGEAKVQEEAREDSAGDDTTKEKSDDDSNEAVGKEEASELDRDMMDDEDNENESKEQGGESGDSQAVANNSKVSSMFQKILSLGTNQSGQIVVKVGDANSTEGGGGAPETGPSTSQPSIIHNGRMMCNLPDHPIHAGATAIVAVMVGRVLTVANAGDSRAVLCRAGGKTVPLSYDHKPQQEREMTRINRAGGFVNHFGRVNGNLNLSRSIGDLKYKQVKGVAPDAQIITAEPDILQLTLDPTDEFIILGCDGIWDCLTNEKAVEFVRERIGRMTPAEIGIEMLDTIISDDPRATQGIGGDNMTVMVVDLQPHSRNRSNPATETPSQAPPKTTE